MSELVLRKGKEQLLMRVAQSRLLAVDSLVSAREGVSVAARQTVSHCLPAGGVDIRRYGRIAAGTAIALTAMMGTRALCRAIFRRRRTTPKRVSSGGVLSSMFSFMGRQIVMLVLIPWLRQRLLQTACSAAWDNLKSRLSARVF